MTALGNSFDRLVDDLAALLSPKNPSGAVYENPHKGTRKRLTKVAERQVRT